MSQTQALLCLAVAVVCPMDCFIHFGSSGGGLNVTVNPTVMTSLRNKIDSTKHWASSLLSGFNHSGPLHSFFSSGKASTPNDLSKWPLENVTFTHPRQSPIDLLTSKAVTKALPTLEIVTTNLNGVQAKFYNSGHTVFVHIKEDASLRPHLVGGPLQGKFIFEQMHFHWGSEDDWGSEHFIDGESFAVEVHLVHWNSNYSSFLEASGKEDGLAVLTVFAEAHDEDNPLLAPLHDLLTNVSEAGSHVTLDSVEAMQWAASALQSNTEYYTYPGSLTTPPFSENVIFILLPTPITLSVHQLSAFRSCHSSEEGHKRIVDNKRQLQPLHNRPIVRSVTVYVQ